MELVVRLNINVEQKPHFRHDEANDKVDDDIDRRTKKGQREVQNATNPKKCKSKETHDEVARTLDAPVVANRRLLRPMVVGMHPARQRHESCHADKRGWKLKDLRRDFRMISNAGMMHVDKNVNAMREIGG